MKIIEKTKKVKKEKFLLPLTLGKLITKLEAIDENLPLYFDDLKHRPTSIGSWRGCYYNLSINYKGKDSINSEEIKYVFKFGDEIYNYYKPIDTTLPKNVKVKDLLKMLKMAVGKTMAGYKGGNFLIDENKSVWVGCYGQSEGYRTNKNYDSQTIVDVIVKENKAILKTALMEFCL